MPGGLAMPNKESEALILAASHYRTEAGITHIYRIESDQESQASEPIKLLEVNENTISSGIMPLQFGPSAAGGIHFSSIIVEVTPQEFSQIQSGQLPLPKRWVVRDLLPRPSERIGA